MVSARKRNRDDSWSYGGVKARDFRQSKDGPEVTGGPKPKKNKMACKKNKGQEHIIVFIIGSWGFRELACMHCNKEFWAYQIKRHNLKFRYEDEETIFKRDYGIL